MKKIFSIISIVAFLLIAYFFFIKPQFDSKKIAIAGEVVSIYREEKGRGKGYLIEVDDDTKRTYIKCKLVDDLNILVGDSIFRKPYSDIFVKSKADGIVRLSNAESPFISQSKR